jgi:hypothetical protein
VDTEVGNTKSPQQCGLFLYQAGNTKSPQQCGLFLYQAISALAFNQGPLCRRNDHPQNCVTGSWRRYVRS